MSDARSQADVSRQAAAEAVEPRDFYEDAKAAIFADRRCFNIWNQSFLTGTKEHRRWLAFYDMALARIQKQRDANPDR